MKKNDWIFIATVFFYSFLFWKQMPGLNFVAFSAILLIGQLIIRPEIIRNRQWIFAAIGTICSSFCVLYYGNALSIFASFFSLLLASYFSFQKDGSLLIGVLSTFVSCCASIGFMISRIVERQKNKTEQTPGKKAGKKTIIVFLALGVALVFFFMYRESSVLFYELTQKINFDWISLAWIGFTILGALVVYGFYFHNSIPGMAEWDGKGVMKISPRLNETFWDKLMSMESEKFSGLVLFSLLNILLLVVNGLDLAFIFNSNGNLPQGVSCMEYVHQGVGMLIASILFAMLIILYYFRGRLNFSENGKALRYLAILWIIQNAFMLFSTAWRNDVYILVFGLTYKRIGVFIYLLLTLIGLLVTAWKVQGKKTNTFLIRTNSWLFYAVWVGACFVNWDGIIFSNNTKSVTKTDMNYLNSLSSDILPELVDYVNTHPKEAKHNHLGQAVQLKAYTFLAKEKFLQDEHRWPSYRIKASSNYDELQYKSIFKYQVALNVNYKELKRIYFFPGFDSIRSIEMAGNDFTDLGELSKFRNLQILDISKNRNLISIAEIEKLDKLEYLSIYSCGIKDYSPLMKMNHLKRIVVDDPNAGWVEKLKAKYPALEIQTQQSNDIW